MLNVGTIMPRYFPLMDARAGRGKWMSKVLESLVVGEVWQKTAFQLIKYAPKMLAHVC